MPELVPELSEIAKMVGEISVSRLSSLAGGAAVELEQTDGADEVFLPWMALILVSGAQVRFTFKTHFLSQTAKELAAPIFRTEAERIKTEQAADFMREFTNLVSGSIKKEMNDLGIPVGTSLPIIIRGFDQVFLRKSQRLGENAHWCLKMGDVRIAISCQIELLKESERVLATVAGRGRA